MFLSIAYAFSFHLLLSCVSFIKDEKKKHKQLTKTYNTKKKLTKNQKIIN
jgi:hypothetical protein